MRGRRRAVSAEQVREISYAHSARSRSGRAVIRSLENLTGRMRLLRMARDYELEIASGRDFWQVMIERYGLSLNVVCGSLESLPSSGPLVVVANHPYGILDGLMLGYILSRTRSDFRILANSVFGRSEDLGDIILPVSFDETPEATKANIETRREALSFLSEGGAIGVFPGGMVSTAARPFGRPMDPSWRRFTARLIAKSGATVAPLYFEGHNTRLFQIASHLHVTLRLGLMIGEFRGRVGKSVEVAIGTPLDPEDVLAHASDAGAMMDYLRGETYALAPRPLPHLQYGFDFS